MNPETDNKELKEGWNMKEQSEKWDQALRSVVGHFSQGSEDEPAENLPHILEKSTWEKADQEKPRQFLLMTGPSGVGKGTIGRGLESQGVVRVPRIITRSRRPGEPENEYHFVSQAEYDELLQQGKLLCPTDRSTSATSCGGIEKDVILSAIKEKKPFYIDGGAGTARQIKKEPELQDVDFSVVFILPPTFKEMVRRLTNRTGQEKELLSKAGDEGRTMDPEVLAKRLEIAITHLRESSETTDFFVVNDEADRAAQRILSLFNVKGK